MTMNWFDLVLLALLLFYALNGMVQGLVKQIVGFLGFFLALLLALFGSRFLAGMIGPYIPIEDLVSAQEVLEIFGAELDLEAVALMVVSVFSFVLLFVVLQIVFRMLVGTLGWVNSIPVIGKINALGGGVLGLLKGMLFVFILATVLSLVPVEVVQAAVGGSEVAGFLEAQMSGLFQLLQDWFETFFLQINEWSSVK